MKRTALLFAICALFSISMSYGQSSEWRLGVRGMWGDNPADFSGGNPNAHATFHTGKHGMGAWTINFQRELTHRWHAEIGLGVSNYGFQAGISKDYSFLDLDKRWTGVGVKVKQLEVPITLIYKHKESCKRTRWFVGAGFALAARAKALDVSKNVNEGKAEVVAANADLNMYYSSKSYAILTGHLMAGVEKRLKRGGLLNAGFYLNPSWTDIADIKVTYSIDGTDYYHEFTNKASYATFFVNYYFAKFGSLNAVKSGKAVLLD